MIECSIELLREHFRYDHETGFIYRAKGKRKGDRAGYLDTKGHRQISIKCRAYLAHRVAWAMPYGEWPMQQIDHKNGVKDDNWIDNLRDVSGHYNQQNRHGLGRKNTKSGVLGVHFAPENRHKKWAANIRVNGILIKIGYYNTVEEAAAAYQTRKKELHPGYLPMDR